MYSNNKNSLNSNRDGFYIGSDGFALGGYSSGHNPFQVTNDGTLYSKKGTIGGFTIGTDTLVGGSGSSTVGLSSKDGIEWAFWSGADHASNAPLRIGHNGSIGNSNGAWNIASDGRATFKDVYITNSQTTLNANDKMIDIGNFSVTAGGTISASSGYISGGIVSSGINAGNITTGMLNITNGGYYLQMGFGDTNHPRVSGLNVASTGGINIGGSSMSRGSVPNVGGSAFLFNDNIYSAGGIYAGTYSTRSDAGVHYGQSTEIRINTSMYQELTGSYVNKNIEFVFKNGLLVGHTVY